MFDEQVTVDRPAAGIAVIRCPEIFDVYVAPKVRETTVNLVNEGCYRLVVDLSRVQKCDSTGLGVLVGALKRTQGHDGTVILDSPNSEILHLLTFTGLTKVFRIVNEKPIGASR